MLQWRGEPSPGADAATLELIRRDHFDTAILCLTSYDGNNGPQPLHTALHTPPASPNARQPTRAAPLLQAAWQCVASSCLSA